MKTPCWMRTLLATLLLPIVVVTMFFGSISPALAADLATGAKVFSANCAACHMKGGNTVNPAKTLKKDALDQNGKNTVEAIVTQVTNGKNAMPPFKGRLQPEQIEAVAAYVLDQSNKGW